MADNPGGSLKLSNGIEQRRVRFSSIEGIERDDLPLACEVWREDIFRSPWADREAMKVATLFVRYIANPDPKLTVLREIESQCQLTREEVVRSFTIMRAYGAIDAFEFQRDDVRVYLHLSLLQRLRVLEARTRMRQLRGNTTSSLRKTPSVPSLPTAI
ncbi:MAG: hypothetical protein ACKVP7_18475 [Hyphomicrobiaceae bacterium]